MSNLVKIFASLLITCVVSTLAALIFKDHFWYVFILVTLLQVIISYTFNQVYTNNLITKIERIKIEQIKESSRNLVVVGCPCDETNEQTVDFRFDTKNVYECKKCGKTFTAVADIKTLLTTDPIYFEKNG